MLENTTISKKNVRIADHSNAPFLCFFSCFHCGVMKLNLNQHMHNADLMFQIANRPRFNFK